MTKLWEKKLTYLIPNNSKFFSSTSKKLVSRRIC